MDRTFKGSLLDYSNHDRNKTPLSKTLHLQSQENNNISALTPGQQDLKSTPRLYSEQKRIQSQLKKQKIDQLKHHYNKVSLNIVKSSPKNQLSPQMQQIIEHNKLRSSSKSKSQSIITSSKYQVQNILNELNQQMSEKKSKPISQFLSDKKSNTTNSKYVSAYKLKKNDQGFIEKLVDSKKKQSTSKLMNNVLKQGGLSKQKLRSVTPNQKNLATAQNENKISNWIGRNEPEFNSESPLPNNDNSNQKSESRVRLKSSTLFTQNTSGNQNNGYKQVKEQKLSHDYLMI